MALRVRKSERGVTLAEVLVSILIISVIGLALIYGTLMTFHASQMAQINVTAEGLARSALEDVRSIIRSSSYHVGDVITMPSRYSDYTDYTIGPPVVNNLHPGDPSPYLLQVTVTVTYVPRQISKVDIEQGIISLTAPGQQVITMTTYMFKP